PLVGLAGAALAAVIRVLVGDSPAALTGAVLAPALAVASLADAGGETARAALALAAAGWTVVELARVPGATVIALGSPPAAVAPAALAALVGQTLGPITAVAALAGLACLPRARYAELALVAAAGGAALVDARAGAVGPATIGLAAVFSGLAVARFAAVIRLPS